MKNKFIVIEGPDGTGKSTLLSALVKAVQTRDTALCIHATKEPTNGPAGAEFRRLLMSFAHPSPDQQVALLLQDRLEHQAELTEHLNKGIVITDRYYHSNLAYQDKDYEELKKLNMMPGIKQPDIVFILTVDIDIALERMSHRQQLDSFENKEKLLQVKTKYERIIADNWSYPLVNIDSSGELDTTLKTVVRYLDELIF